MRSSIILVIALAAGLVACDRKTESPQQGSGDCSTTGAVGASRLTFRSDVVYSAEFAGGGSGSADSLHLRAVFVGRGAPGWSERPDDPTGAPQRPAWADSLGFVNGGALGTVWVGHNRERTEAVVGADRIVMDTFNIFLVDRIDSIGGPPAVVKRLRLQRGFALPPTACGPRGFAEFSPVDSLEALLMRTAEVRDFASERADRTPGR